jgi:hypothetical protein
LSDQRSTNFGATSPRSILKFLNKRMTSFGSKRNIPESLAFTTFWTFVVLVSSLQNGFSSKIPILNISSNSSSSEIREAWGQGDAGSLLEVAITWAKLDPLDEVTQFWIPRLWAPGMAMIEVPLIWLERAGVPLFWSLLALIMMIWGGVMFLVWRYFSPLLGRIPTAFVLVGLIYTWDFGYLLRDYIFYTEGISYGFLLIGLILMTVRVTNPNCLTRRSVVFAGVMLGLSLWVRHTNESGLTFFLVIVLLMNLAYKFKKSAELRTFKRHSSKKKVITFMDSAESNPKFIWLQDLGIFAVVAFLVTVPWRLISTFHFGGFPFAMSSASGGVPVVIWSTPDSPNGQYWGVYGSNWACKIDQITCAAVQSDIQSGVASGSHLLLLAALSALRNPIQYIDERFSFLFTHWIPKFSLEFTYQNLVALTFFFVFASIFLIFFRLKDQRKYPILIIWGSFLLMNLVQLSIIHYESRYFIPVRLLTLGAFIGLYLIRSEGQIKEKSTADPSGVSKNDSVG